MPGLRLLFVLSMLAAAGCGPSLKPLGEQRGFRVLPLSPNEIWEDFDIPMKRLDGKLLLRRDPRRQFNLLEDYILDALAPNLLSPAKPGDWDRAQPILRDTGPESLNEHLDLPAPGQPLRIDGRAYPSRGQSWVHVLFSTGGASVALFTLTSHNIPPTPKPYPSVMPALGSHSPGFPINWRPGSGIGTRPPD